MTEMKIKIENLYKIFGKNPQAAMALVKDGISKQDMLEQHRHVLGLKDINIDVPAPRHLGDHGAFRFRQVHPDSPHQPLDRTHLRQNNR